MQLNKNTQNILTKNTISVKIMTVDPLNLIYNFIILKHLKGVCVIMSKLNKYLKSIAGGKAYKKACKKLMKNIAKERDNINLLANANLSGVAGGVPGGMPEVYKKKIVKKNGSGSANPDPHGNINNQIYASMPISDPQQWWNGWVPDNGNIQPEVGYTFDGDLYGPLSEADLNSVAGGSEEEEEIEIADGPDSNPAPERYGRLVYGLTPEQRRRLFERRFGSQNQGTNGNQ